jgi:general stress protein 26
MTELEQKIYEKLKQPTLSALATVTEDGKPWVRYVTPFADKTLTIWIATFIESRKVAQIRKNPAVHLTTGVTDPMAAETYLQIQGRAEILTDPETKRAVWFDHLKAIFTGADDPKYAVVKIVPDRIEYQTMTPVPPAVWLRRA